MRTSPAYSRSPRPQRGRPRAGGGSCHRRTRRYHRDGGCGRRRPGQAPAPRPVTHASAGTPAVAVPVSARGFLLTSAVTAARTPAVSGSYWYIRTRDYTTTVARPPEPAVRPGATPARKKVLPKQLD